MFPKKLREKYSKNLILSGIKNPKSYSYLILAECLFFSTLLILANYILITKNPISNLFVFLALFIFFQLFFYFRFSLKSEERIKKMEDMFPDFIQLMASNLRAGMTIDRALLLSAREEFYPLNEEILRAGREITTGREIISVLNSLSQRIGSEKIDRTIKLIISGLKAGGNISVLLEQTSSNMREKEFIEKRATSNISMYVIFIFIAAGLGAPLLFGLSSVLVEAIIKITSSIPELPKNSSLPIAFGAVNLSKNFVLIFSLLFVSVSSLLSSLVIGLINKGREKEGLKYFIPLLLAGVSVFFIIRKLLLGFILDTLSFG